MTGLDLTEGQILWLALGLARTAAAFLMLPLLGSASVPPLVRNSIIVSCGLIVLLQQPDAGTLAVAGWAWMAVLCREIFIGTTIGFFFGGVVWSLQLAGQFIDDKIGPNHAIFTDPFTGEQTSVFAVFLARLANYVFVSGGGLLYLTGVLLRSYAIWPISASGPSLRLVDSLRFTDAFQGMMALGVALATPVLLLLTFVEAGAGLLNRFAPKLNVFTASLSIKNWLAAWVLLLMSGMIVQTLTGLLATREETVMLILSRLRG